MFSAKHGLSTNEIADLMDEFDDSDVDKDYRPEGNKTNSEDELEAHQRGGRPAMDDLPEIRVFMDPPIERPDGDTDKDSGKFDNINIYLFFCQLTQ